MFKSKYVKNILTLFSSAVFAQILALLFTPVLTRLYSPENFGMFTVFLSYSSTLAIFLFLSSELAIVQSKTKRQFNGVLGVMLLISAIILSFLCVTIYLESDFYRLIGFDKLFKIKEVVIVGVVFAGLNLGLNQVITRNEQFSIYAKSQVCFVLLRFIFSFLFFYFGITEYGLVFGFTIATLLIVAYLTYKTRIYRERPNLCWSSLVITARKYNQLILYNTPSNFLNMLLVNFPVFFILKNYGIEAAGFFGLAYRMIMLPVSLVNKAVGQVMYKRFTEMSGKPKHIFNFIVKNIVLLSASMPAFVIIYIFGEELFALVFGQQWEQSGRFASLLAPYIFFSFLVSPLSYYFVAYNKSRLLMAISAFFLAFLIGLTLIIDIHSVQNFILYYSIVNICYYITVLLVIFMDIKRAKLNAEV